MMSTINILHTGLKLRVWDSTTRMQLKFIMMDSTTSLRLFFLMNGEANHSSAVHSLLAIGRVNSKISK